MEENTKKEMEVRSLELQDCFKLSEILDAMDVNIDLNEIMEKVKELQEQNRAKKAAEEAGEEYIPPQKEKSITERVGAQLALSLIKKLHKGSQPCYELIADISNATPEVAKHYKFRELSEFFTKILEDPEFPVFFQ